MPTQIAPVLLAAQPFFDKAMQASFPSIMTQVKHCEEGLTSLADLIRCDFLIQERESSWVSHDSHKTRTRQHTHLRAFTRTTDNSPKQEHDLQ